MLTPAGAGATQHLAGVAVEQELGEGNALLLPEEELLRRIVGFGHGGVLVVGGWRSGRATRTRVAT